MRIPSSEIGLLAGLLLLNLPLAQAETLIPLNGQSPEQIQSDIAACQSQAGSASQSTSSAAGGERLRGAAKGAAAGAAAAQIRGNRHDEIYGQVNDDIKQEYRQNQARETAAIGMVAGGAKHRQNRREASQDASTGNSQAYNSCMTGRGYSISP